MTYEDNAGWDGQRELSPTAMSSKSPSPIPAPVTGHQGSKSIPQWRKITATCLLLVLAAPFLPSSNLTTAETHLLTTNHGAQCPVQPRAVHPKVPFKWDEAYKSESAKRLSRAVVSFPLLGIGTLDANPDCG